MDNTLKEALLGQLQQLQNETIAQIDKLRALVHASFPEIPSGPILTKEGMDLVNHTIGFSSFSSSLYSSDGFLRRFFSPVVVPGGVGKMRPGQGLPVYTDDLQRMSAEDLLRWPMGFYRSSDTLDTQLLLHISIGEESDGPRVPFVFYRLDQPNFVIHYPSENGWVEFWYQRDHVVLSSDQVTRLKEHIFTRILNRIFDAFTRVDKLLTN